MREALLVGTAAVALAGSTGAATAPKVALVDRSPIVVHGSSFKAYEHVRIRVLAGGQSALRAVRATARGSFTTRFGTLSVGTCASYWIRATGDRGSHALLRLLPECANGPTP